VRDLKISGTATLRSHQNALRAAPTVFNLADTHLFPSVRSDLSECTLGLSQSTRHHLFGGYRAGYGPHTPGSFNLRSATSTADCSSEHSWCPRNSKTWGGGSDLAATAGRMLSESPCNRPAEICRRICYMWPHLCPIPAYPDPMQTSLECSIS
jgi:hypothetical protein